MVTAFLSILLAIPPVWEETQWVRFWSALRMVETGGEPNQGIGCVTPNDDGGDAYGPLQIRECCWTDAVEYDSTLESGSWEQCKTDLQYSRKVCRAYVNRYLPKDGTMIQAARIWYGGPKGYQKKSTLGYAKKFQKELEKIP